MPASPRLSLCRVSSPKVLSWATLLALPMTLLTGGSAHAQDKFVGQAIPASQRVSHDAIDHSTWDKLLRQFVNTDGQVNYKAWKASPQAVAALDQYINLLSTGDQRKPASREATLAYWINAYNAVTVKGMLEVYPTTSIRNHTAKLWGYNIWKNLKLRANDTPINLNDIEHEVLRKMNEPRIHFAIVCASIGCPRLLNEAYVPQRLNEQLEINSKDFFSRRQNFQVSGSRVQLSSILSWFGEDFGPNQQAQLQAVAKWAPASAQSVLTSGRASVSYLDYDWGINEQK